MIGSDLIKSGKHVLKVAGVPVKFDTINFPHFRAGNQNYG